VEVADLSLGIAIMSPVSGVDRPVWRHAIAIAAGVKIEFDAFETAPAHGCFAAGGAGKGNDRRPFGAVKRQPPYKPLI
jgi:hypothetical protein